MDHSHAASDHAGLDQARVHLELVATLADDQERDDPFSSWRDVGLHAQLAAAHVELVSSSLTEHRATDTLAGLAPIEPGSADLAQRGRALLDIAASLLGSFNNGESQQPEQTHLHQARLELGRALSFMPAGTRD